MSKICGLMYVNYLAKYKLYVGIKENFDVKFLSKIGKKMYKKLYKFTYSFNEHTLSISYIYIIFIYL
jgi:hypothetical protein